MSCKSCGTENLSSLNSEINIHFAGYSGLTKPTVWAFPAGADAICEVDFYRGAGCYHHDVWRVRRFGHARTGYAVL